MRPLPLAALAIATLAVFSGLADAALPEPRVIAAGTQFVPAVLVVAPGETVTWESPFATHTVSTAISFVNAVQQQGDDPTNSDADPDTFHATLAPASAVERAFTQPGIHSYFCELHSGMIGTIVVE